MTGADFPAEAQALLGALGYRSERTLPDQSGDVADFIVPNPDTNAKQEFRREATSVHVLFQVTDEEITQTARSQPSMFQDNTFNEGNVRSFFFMAVELRGESYSRGKYAQLTREVNKRFPAPAVVFFRTAAGLVTLSFVHRRVNKRNPERDVIGSVSLVREIRPANAHRAHLDILAELSLPDRLGWMGSRRQPPNFDGLLAAWLDSLDTEELNRRFYKEISEWFDRAVAEARFPADGSRPQKPEEHVIRLIARLLFVWFIKEKGLVADDLFNEARIAELLKDYDPAAGDSYYRAILQNLFFATLNTGIGQRDFSQESNNTHRNFSRYRYLEEMSDPGSLLGLFAQTPFINGGLFDCLDSEEVTGTGGYRIDYFTDNFGQRRGFSIPNPLFFDNAGLITLFNHYKFTVEENTPAEMEVALDPELLGKVFENLLATYNPETRENARKQTGSFYTPRAVVDYMVDEALVASLGQKTQPTDGDDAFWQERLRYLLDYADAFEDAMDLFNEDERDAVIRAIAGLRVLDPAVGSGAFPMGILHKLTLALRRLDPRNERWEALQRKLAGERAKAVFHTTGQDQKERDAELDEISDTFERYRDSDFGRKLYLIQNSIYGVDIQAVACQIAKLRFFISLAIEQIPDPGASNFGIHPLPNLETRFVAANTLLGLEKPAQPVLQSEAVLKLEGEVTTNRERHFHTGVRHEKLRLHKEDARLRGLLARELRSSGFPVAAAESIAHWDPFDPNARAGWFDPEYMFGVKEGFDVVIGNPPYIHIRRLEVGQRQMYANAGFDTFAHMGDLYQLFYEKGFQLLTPHSGILSYITSNSWLKGEYGKSSRRYLSEKQTILQLLEMGKDVFENTIVDTNILIALKGKRDIAGNAVDMDVLADKTFPPAENLWSELTLQGDLPWSVLSSTEKPVMDKIGAIGTPLKDWDVAIHVGIVTGFNQAFVIDHEVRQALVIAEPESADIIKPVLRGRDIRRYRAQWAGLWIINMHNGYRDVPAVKIEEFPVLRSHLNTFYPQLKLRRDQGKTPYNLRDCAFYEDYSREKLVWIELVDRGRFAFEDKGMHCLNTTFFMVGQSLKYLCAVLNSRLMTWFVRSTALNSGMGTTRWIRGSVERIPIPQISKDRQHPFVNLVDIVLSAKEEDLDADTSAQEAEIDRLVYELYGLTEEEVAVVEGRIE